MVTTTTVMGMLINFIDQQPSFWKHKISPTSANTHFAAPLPLVATPIFWPNGKLLKINGFDFFFFYKGGCMVNVSQ